MPAITVMVDSACDIEPKFAREAGIRVLGCHVQTDEGSFLDGEEFTAADVYRMVEETGKLPMTSQVTAIDWMNAYLDAYREGSTDIIVVTMNKEGSGTYASACQAVTLLEDEDEAAAKALSVRVIDSTGYSAPVGVPLVRAAEMIKNGDSAAEIADYLENWYSKQVTLLGLGSLEYAKRSGRLSTVAAFVGEVLGLKPIMYLHGENKVVDKARGQKLLTERMAKLYMEKAADPKGDWAIVWGTNRDEAEDLIAAIEKLGGSAPLIEREIGTCVAINAGPKMLGIGFLGRDDAF